MYNAFGSSVFGNDDDIFDDNKSLSDADSLQKEDTTSHKNNFNKKDLRNAAEAAVNVLNIIMENGTDSKEAKEIIDQLRKDHGVGVDHLLGKFRVYLASTIIDGAGSWIANVEVFNIPRSVMYALDSMCDNKFSLIDKYFNLELENAKRIVISKFLKDLFLSNTADKVSAFMDVFQGGFDTRYLSTYYEVLYEINEFTIFQNNGVYAALASELNLPCNQNILDNKEVRIQDLTSGSYSDHRFTSALGSDLRKTIAKSVAHYTERYIDYVNQKGN